MDTIHVHTTYILHTVNVASVLWRDDCGLQYADTPRVAYTSITACKTVSGGGS